MECQKCHFDNEESSKYCLRCGERLKLQCPQCGKVLPLLAEFCNQCGQKLEDADKTENNFIKTDVGRKHVTVLFSDMSGYTAICEILDPEEVKEITSRIFGEIEKIIERYDGFIEKFVGDAVMAIFGIPIVHEDDPLRSIKAAIEIHQVSENLSHKSFKKTGKSILMHTGINTGLVITGNLNMEKGTHGLSGDTINIASRLSSLAKPGEILVGPDTYQQAEGYFSFESLGIKSVKGKSEKVKIYKVLSQKERPINVHRLSGLRADLVGRRMEMIEFRHAIENLYKGRGKIFSIIGDAGTGKSRLVEEFKAYSDLRKIQWIEGHSYSYAQNITYFPLIDFLNRTFNISENESSEIVRKKIDLELENLVEKPDNVAPYIGSLYSLKYPQLEDVSPELWKSRLRDAIKMILIALSRRKYTVFLLEDLHWADPSFVDLIRHILLEIRQPAIVLCVYRPTFQLFTTNQIKSINRIYQELRIQDLSASEAQNMMESLLKTDNIPFDLRRLVQEKAEGNPFYLEELVNSLIETETLIQNNDCWIVTKPINESDIPSTIHGVIVGRLDRLENKTKRILQEASVIGRVFFFEILKRITELVDNIDTTLGVLEKLDIVRTRTIQPDLEYMFKHALTQEVAYNGLLKKERYKIHERIAFVMEELFHDRLPEFYETLAFHFVKGQSDEKAVEYLVKSGEKSLERYSVEEAHQYFNEAFGILTKRTEKNEKEKKLLVDFLSKWALVFYYRGDFKGLTNLLSSHMAIAESVHDKETLGMYYMWMGATLWEREKFRNSYEYLQKALKLGEETKNLKVAAYSSAWLIYTCMDLGLLNEAISYGEMAERISKSLKSDQFIHFHYLGGLGLAYWYKGEKKKACNDGKALMEFGHRYSNFRSMTWGHLIIGLSDLIDGDFSSGIKSIQRSLQVSADPFYSQFPRLFLGMSYVYNRQFEEAEEPLKEVLAFSKNLGTDTIGTPAQSFLGIVLFSKGQMAKGLRLIEEGQRSWLKNEAKFRYAMLEYVLGNIYFNIVKKKDFLSLSMILKNIGFLVKSIPFASKKSEKHFNKAIEISKEIGAKGILGPAYLDLGLFHKATKRMDQASECISEAIKVFQESEVESYLNKAKEALESSK
jgi:class 3 adenylate cyclase/tetratricopeptide (TPR) repeat protein